MKFRIPIVWLPSSSLDSLFARGSSQHWAGILLCSNNLGVWVFTITHRLSKLDFAIHLAKISTDVDRVADVFYVADAQGRKVLDDGRLRDLREALHRELEPRHDG